MTPSGTSPSEPSSSGASSRPAAPSRPRLGLGARLALQLGVSLVIAGFFVWLMREGALELIPTAEAFHSLRWWVVPLYLMGWSAVHVLRAVRWKLLLAPLADVPTRRVLEASFIGYLAILVLPLRTGEVVRPMLIRRRGELSAWAAAGTIGAERIVDGLMMSGILLLSLQVATPLDPLPERLGDLPISVAVIPRAAYLAVLAFAGALTLMVAFFKWRRAARRLIGATVGLVSRPLARWVTERLENVSQGLSFLSTVRQSALFVTATLAYWLANAGCAWLLAWGVGFDDIQYAQACVVIGVLALSIMVPNAPGFFGAFQFSLYAGLALFYPREDVLSKGAAFVLLVYLCQITVTFGFAGWASLSSGLSVWRAWLAARRRA